MPIIDPRGLFHGQRLSRCSTLAQLYWPRFFLAANGYGRMELDYGSLLAGPLASLEPKPSMSQVADMFGEYRDNFLLFMYIADGQAWGQWDCPDRYLQRHKTACDRRSPPPPENEYKAWRMVYREENTEFQKFLRSPRKLENLRAGVGVVVGVGEGIGEGIGKKQILSRPRAGEGKLPGLHGILRDRVQQQWLIHNPSVPTCPWGAAEGKQLKTMLEKTPGWTIEQYENCIRHFFGSGGISPSTPPLEMLPKLPKYLNGPLNEFGKVNGNGNGKRQTCAAEERWDRVKARAVRAVNAGAGDTGPIADDAEAGDDGAGTGLLGG